ncbi:MAG: glycosyltransferase family 39 protein [Salinivirgaceae bacterium]
MKSNIKFSVVIIIVLLASLYHHKDINEFPSHIHAWAQSDRYALSLGFVDNGLNFFKPQTFVYNHQFPYNWNIPSESSITAVDFPIHDYIPALLMKLSGNTSPWLFRLYILIYSLFGLFFLFKLAFAITNDYFKSILVLVFAATSPVYVYYQNGFLPTIPSLSNTIIGIYLYYNHFKDNKQSDFVLSILFLTLAALSRTTFAIPLIAVLCIEFIRIIKKEISIIPKIIPVSISMFLLIIYQLYNGYLREQYGSIFLNHLLPPNNLEEVIGILKEVYRNWGLQYFTKIHYLIFGFSLLAALFFLIARRIHSNKAISYFGLFVLVYFIGCALFSFLMLQQFPAHDYYFLDTFFTPVIMLLIVLLSYLPSFERKNMKIGFIAILCFLSIALIFQPIKSQENRRDTGSWDKTESLIQNYDGSSKFIDSIGVSKDSKILVLDAVVPNIPFILMQRKGFVVMSTSRENIEKVLQWEYDYIVFQNDYFVSDIYTSYPEILSGLKKIADNGRISVCKLSKSNNPQNLLAFIGLNDKIPVFEQFVSFENRLDTLWQNFNTSNRYSFSGNLSGHLTPENEFGLTFKTKNLPILITKSSTLMFSSYFLSDTIVNSEIVISISVNGQNIFYKSYNLKDIIQKQKSWENISLLFQLPKIQSNDYEFALFLWNTGKSEIYYDDFSFAIY